MSWVEENGVASQRTYCVTHEAPMVPDHLADYVIGIGDYHPQRGAHIAALDAFWDRMRPYSYGAAGNYVIPLAMDATGPTHLTGIFSHRKIIVRTQIGKPSAVLDFYHEVTVPEAKGIPREEIEPRPGCEFLIGFPLKFHCGVVEHYIETHLGIDLFEYVSMAVGMGILTLDEAQAFAEEKFLIPGGCELGVYPTAWVRPVLEKLENLGREFVTRCAPRIGTYDNFQVRAVGFLAERLGSFFLLTELKDRFPGGIPSELCGYLCAIVPPGGSYQNATV
jgi:hypothetical protein